MSSSDHLPLTAVWGPPRSGTTWLGQIFDSHPAVAYRFQPLFSYRFKAAVSQQSTGEQVFRFLDELARTDDDFVCQTSKRSNGIVPVFQKSAPRRLVFKEVRYLHLAGHFLQSCPTSVGIAIIRHPCATMNSWLKTPREFAPNWNWRNEWRGADSKNQGRSEEYYGFERWKWAARHFLGLAEAHPSRFFIVRYEDLVSAPASTVMPLFAACGLDFAPQTAAFIRSSQTHEFDHPDSVFRTPDVKDRWKVELPTEVGEAILAECRNTPLEQFCR